MSGRPFLLGLTGSIGMGKSTAAGFFREAGVPVWDADEAVHRLYAPGGDGAAAIAALRPGAVVDGAVDRGALKDWIAAEPEALAAIERAVHPLVAADRAAFTARHAEADLVVLDIPLLFEKGYENQVDAIVVVSAPAAVQRARVLQRPGMTEETFALLLSKQLPDADKRARADFVIPSVSLQEMRAAVFDLVKSLRRERRHA